MHDSYWIQLLKSALEISFHVDYHVIIIYVEVRLLIMSFWTLCTQGSRPK